MFIHASTKVLLECGSSATVGVKQKTIKCLVFTLKDGLRCEKRLEVEVENMKDYILILLLIPNWVGVLVCETQPERLSVCFCSNESDMKFMCHGGKLLHVQNLTQLWVDLPVFSGRKKTTAAEFRIETVVYLKQKWWISTDSVKEAECFCPMKWIIFITRVLCAVLRLHRSRIFLKSNKGRGGSFWLSSEGMWAVLNEPFKLSEKPRSCVLCYETSQISQILNSNKRW